VKVAVVAEFYPRRTDPVLGIWAHRQALAARDAGAETRVIVLYRLVPPRAALTAGPRALTRAAAGLLRQPPRETRDGLEILYVPFVSPERSRAYASWGAWAAGPLAVALRALQRTFPFDLIHAHNAVPAADAVRRARLHVPLVVSVHGGDVFYTAPRSARGRDAVTRALAASQLVLANSAGVADLASSYGARATRVVHLGTDLPQRQATLPRLASPGLLHRGPPAPLRLVTVAHLVPRKRHGDVIRALAVLRRRHPDLRYLIIGDGPERVALARLAERLGVSHRVELRGQLDPDTALATARRCSIFVMPSTEEAFGVAYIEAMASGLPAIGCRGEPGPEEIAKAGDGMLLVPPGDVERLSQRIDELVSDPDRLLVTGRRARATVAQHFTWRRCGQETVAAYADVLA
jgi:teichuronic acid biosynthesis glycosyltransferase TuaC